MSRVGGFDLLSSRTRCLLALVAPRLVFAPLEPEQEGLRRLDGQKFPALDRPDRFAYVGLIVGMGLPAGRSGLGRFGRHDPNLPQEAGFGQSGVPY